MENLLKKITEDVATEIAKAFTSDQFAELVTKTKGEGESRAFEVIISTSAIDRHGETILQSGWDFKNYMANPVVLWGHDYHSLPVGIVTEIIPDGEKTIARGIFAPAEANPLAEQLFKLYQLGMLKTVSVGFIPKEYNGNQITKAELLELSFVSVPANPEALSTGKALELGLDMDLIKQKNVIAAEIEPVAEKQAEAIATEEAVLAELKKFEDGEGTVNVTTKLLQELVSVKAGRVLSAKTRELIKTAIDGLQPITGVLQELYDATDPQGTEGKQADNGTAPEPERSNPSGVTDAQSNSFTEMLKGKPVGEAEALKEALRFVATAAGDALHAFKTVTKTK